MIDYKNIYAFQTATLNRLALLNFVECSFLRVLLLKKYLIKEYISFYLFFALQIFPSLPIKLAHSPGDYRMINWNIEQGSHINEPIQF